VPFNYARLGFASIDVARIEPGLATLALARAKVTAWSPRRWPRVAGAVAERADWPHAPRRAGPSRGQRAGV